MDCQTDMYVAEVWRSNRDVFRYSCSEYRTLEKAQSAAFLGAGIDKKWVEGA
jgi:hypothetical protein